MGSQYSRFICRRLDVTDTDLRSVMPVEASTFVQ